MNYQETLRYLDELTRTGIKLGLDNTRALLEYFDNPHLKIPTLHIAGTNGKGSTAAFAESILRAAGWRTGLYTSPHLLDFRERIQVNRKRISPDQLSKLAGRVRQAAERLNIQATYFEVGTVMAFLHFQESGCQWNLIEVGLGGRLDSTNLCQPLVSVITSISRDHESSLGNTLPRIAQEKAAIIKSGGTVIAGSQTREVESVIRNRARDQGVRVLGFGRDFTAERTGGGPEGQVFDWAAPGRRLRSLETGLLGLYQVENAALAVAACLAGAESLSLSLPEKAIREGIKTARWPGRLEVVNREPWVVLDCAHNADAVKKLARALRDHFPYQTCRVVLGVMEDKNLAKIVEIIEEISDHTLLVRPRGRRSADPSNLFKLFKNNNKVIEIIEEIPYALHTAQKLSGPQDLVLVTGSVFTVAEAKQSFEFQGTP